jgi:hypothetical protein
MSPLLHTPCAISSKLSGGSICKGLGPSASFNTSSKCWPGALLAQVFLQSIQQLYNNPYTPCRDISALLATYAQALLAEMIEYSATL